MNITIFKKVYTINSLETILYDEKLVIQEVLKHICEKKIKKVVIEQPVVLDETKDSLYSIVFLRELTSLGLIIDWKTENNNYNFGKIYHIFPPKLIINDHHQELENWKTSYCYGLLHYRKGPDFILIEDKRSGSFKLNYNIGDMILLEIIKNDVLFNKNHKLEKKEKAAVQLLFDHNLILKHGDYYVFLPYRLR
ncbi:DUF5825 family protein [Lysinibacillus xylanilyticus]|uniref:DUF5825 family protein n=1 Tax=Lysinibacillus xylanilyticus TaxID=582475 RepID=UPI003D08992F